TSSARRRRSAGAAARGGGRRPRRAGTRPKGLAAAWCRRPRSWRPPQQQRRVADGVAAVAADQRHLAVLHLPVRRPIAAHLVDRLDDLEHALAVALGELAAGGVRRQRTVEMQCAGGGEGAALALGAEAVV